jgi:hypothetical protein
MDLRSVTLDADCIGNYVGLPGPAGTSRAVAAGPGSARTA